MRRRSGLTLVELLVVVAIIALLIALLFPAIQGARESARITTCRKNLKQLALGLVHYEVFQGAFPPSAQYVGSEDPAATKNVRFNWAVLLLPYIEELALSTAVTGTFISDAANRPIRTTRLPVMLCPTDSFNQTDYNGTYYTVDPSPWARGNYATNGGRGFMMRADVYLSREDAMVGPNGPGWKGGWTGANAKQWRGVMGASAALEAAAILDGAGNTILLGEVRAGLVARDNRGTWALAGSPSSLWGYGSQSDANGPNYCGDLSDDFVECQAVTDQLGVDAMRRECMTCWPSPGNWEQTVRSLHRNGANLAFADGSVRFVSDWVETRTSFGSVWDRLICSGDGLPVDPTQTNP